MTSQRVVYSRITVFLLQSIINMHNHTPKEPIPPPLTRERPLQKSMFLPEHYPPTAPVHPQQVNELPPFNQLKRSLIETPAASTANNQFQFRTGVNNSINYNTYQPPAANHASFALIDSRPGPHHEMLQHSNSTSNIKPSSGYPQRMEPPGDYDAKNFNKLEKGKTSFVQPLDNKTLINEVVNEIKDRHLPSLLSIVKKQFHDEISQLRQEFISFREEVKGNKSKQDLVNNQFRSQTGPSRGNDGQGQRKASLTDKDKEMAELQKDFFLLESKMKQLESKVNEGFSVIGHSIDSINIKIDQHPGEISFKSSAVRSSLPPIMLEYREVFLVKTPVGVGQGSRKSPSEQEITLSSCSYYVDKSGYLMDSDSRYLVDQRGGQIRLDEKHLKILEKHRILYR